MAFLPVLVNGCSERVDATGSSHVDAMEVREVAQGTYEKAAPALVMVGHWGLTFEVTPPRGRPFQVLLVDKAEG